MMRITKRLLRMFLLTLSLSGGSVTLAQVPVGDFAYEGYLTDSVGDPIVSPSYPLKVLLYTSDLSCLLHVQDVSANTNSIGFFSIEFHPPASLFRSGTKTCYDLNGSNTGATNEAVAYLKLAILEADLITWTPLDGEVKFQSTALAMNAHSAETLGGTQGKQIIQSATSGFFGVANTDPQTLLDVAGSIRVGTDSALTCVSQRTGALRWNSTNLELCNGSQWSPLVISSELSSELSSKLSDVTNQASLPHTKIWVGDGSGKAQPNFVNLSHLKINDGTEQFPASGCSSNETLTWSASNSTASCTPISIAATGVSGLAASATIDTTSASNITSGTLSVLRGGTGLTSLAEGSLLYASDINTLQALSAGSEGQILTVVSGLPSWSNAPSALPAPPGSASSPSYAFSSDLNSGLFSPASGTIGLSTQGVERLRIDSTGSVGVGTSIPHASAILDLSSNTKGLLIPRVDTTQRNAIASPATGLQIYNTSTNEINFYNGSSWQALGVAGAGISSITAGNGLVSTTITTSGTIEVNVGTGPNQIVQLDGNSKLPEVDGSRLLNVAALTANSATSATSAISFTGSLAGDVTGVQGNTRVERINGVSVSAAVTGDNGKVLTYDSAVGWRPQSITLDYTSGNLTNKPTLGLLADNDSIDLSTSDATGTLAPSMGGTGLTGIVSGDLIYGSGTDTFSRLAAGSNGMILTLSGGLPSWSTAPLELPATTGSASMPSYAFNGNSDTGMFRPETNAIGFSTGGSEKLRISTSGAVGVGTTMPQVKLDVAGAMASGPIDITAGSGGRILLRELTANGEQSVGFRAPDAVSSSILWQLPDVDGANGQVLTTDGAGVLSWTSASGSGSSLSSLNGLTESTQTFAIDTSGNALAFSSSSGVHTLSIPMASTSPSVAAGLLSNTDYANFQSKLSAVTNSAPLVAGKVWVGDASNIAQEEWFGVDDLKTAAGVQQFATNCSASQTLIWSAVTDAFACTNIAISSAQITGLASSATTDTTDANNITSGILALAQGGTGASTREGAVNALLPDQASNGGNFLSTNGTTVSWAALPSSLPASAGTAAAPGYAFSGYTNTGIFSPGPNSIGFSTDGTERMRINEVGNVGVGVSSPQVKLDVEGAIASGPIASTVDSGGRVLLRELAANGTHSVGFRAPDQLTSDLLWQLPDAPGAPGQVLTKGDGDLLAWEFPRVQTVLTESAKPVGLPASHAGRMLYVTSQESLEIYNGANWSKVPQEKPASDISVMGNIVDWAHGARIKYTVASCQSSFTFTGIKDGVPYTFVIKGPAAASNTPCNVGYSGPDGSNNPIALSVHPVGGNPVQDISQHVVIKFFRAGNDVYIEHLISP